MSTPNPYHLEIQTNKKKPYGLLRTSYREDGKVKHKTLATLPGLTLSQLKGMQAALQNKVAPIEDFKILSSREFGASHVALSIAKELGLHKIIHSNYSQNWVKSSLAMIIGRLVYQGSKLSLSHCGSDSVLWEICGITEEVDVSVHCYDAMDKLFARQESIQQALAKKHLTEGTLILYDITSCYMEGEYKHSEIVEFGYSRDKKRSHEQIVISLLCSKDGCPIAVEVFSGNTSDQTTVIDKINEIKQKYGIEKVIFVGDRGMITQTVYDKIDHKTVKSITALKHGGIQKLLNSETIQLSLFDEKNIVEIVDGDARYMLCKNPESEQREAAARKRLLELTCKELDEIIATNRKTKYSKEVRMGKVLNKYKMGKFVIIEGTDDQFSYHIDNDKVEKEAALDGCYIIFTDVGVEDMSAVEIVKNYKSLIKVEQAFRNLKTTQLEMRPIYHKRDDRIKCHVFICMLAYYVMWHMRQRLISLAEIDGSGKDRKYSFAFVMERLKSIRRNDVDFMGARTYVTTTPDEEQSMILDMLGVSL